MLKQIPTDDDLARIYFELSKIGARCVGALKKWPYNEVDKYKLLGLASEMSRYDPRLFSILVEYFICNWKEINPTKVRDLYSLLETPQLFGVIGEFMKSAERSPEATYYVNYLISGLQPVSAQFLFHGIYQIGGTLAKKAMEMGLVEYKRWGFMAAQKPVIETETKISLGRLDASSRINILKKILERKKIIKISDYLKALDNTISRQQALLDLTNCNFAQKTGAGRGAKWKLAT